jgi:hypothetical protein
MYNFKKAKPTEKKYAWQGAAARREGTANTISMDTEDGGKSYSSAHVISEKKKPSFLKNMQNKIVKNKFLRNSLLFVAGVAAVCVIGKRYIDSKADMVRSVIIHKNEKTTLPDSYKDGVVEITRYNDRTKEKTVNYWQVLSDVKSEATQLGGRNSLDLKNEEKSYQEMPVDFENRRKLSLIRFSPGGTEEYENVPNLFNAFMHRSTVKRAIPDTTVKNNVLAEYMSNAKTLMGIEITKNEYDEYLKNSHTKTQSGSSIFSKIKF